MHLHNLDIEGLAGVMSNPHVAFRWEQIQVLPVDFESLRQRLTAGTQANEPQAEVTEVMDKLDRLTLSAHKCPLCHQTFGDEESLKVHISTVHPETHSANPRECTECGSGKILGSAQSLTRHVIAVHRTCKTCKKVFESGAKLQQHKVIHTTCTLCGTDWGFASRLTKHMKSHQKTD